MTLKIFFICLAILCGISFQGHIIPDPQTPFYLAYPASNSNLPQSLVFKFSLASVNGEGKLPITPSYGLGYKQYIGIQFPQTTDIGMSGLVYGCSLKGSSEITVKKDPSVANSAGTTESNALYCQIDDTVNTLSPGTTYTLTFTLSGAWNLKSSVKTISLFTALMNNSDRIILDNSPAFAIMGTYADFATYTNKIFDTTVTSVTPNLNQSFSLETKIVFNQWHTFAENLFVFRFDPTYYSLTGSALSGTAVKIVDEALPSSMTLKPYYSPSGTQAFYIDGWDAAEFLKGKGFVLKLTGMQAIKIGSGKIEFLIIYKNTHSIVSYYSTTLTIAGPTLSISAVHPETIGTSVVWDYFKNGAHPILFTITSSLDLTNSYILIQHSTFSDTARLTFIAASCDFNKNTNLSDLSTFGKRPACFPMRLDNAKAADNTAAGSGFFFYLKSLPKETSFYVNIWAFFNECGGNTDTLFQNTTTGTGTVADPFVTTTAYTVPAILWDTKYKADIKFSVTAYSSISVNQYGEARFGSSALSIGTASTQSALSCYNTWMGEQRLGGYFAIYDAAANADYAGTILATTKDRLEFKEYTDWEIIAWNGSATIPSLVSTAADFPIAYLYGSASPLATTANHIYIRTTVSTPANSAATLTNISTQHFPFPIRGSSMIPGTLHIRYSAAWVEASTTYALSSAATVEQCHAAWNVGKSGDTPTLAIETTIATAAAANNKAPSFLANKVTATGSSKAVKESLILESELKANYMTSITVDGGQQPKFAFAPCTTASDSTFGNPVIGVAAAASAMFGFVDNCHKWKIPGTTAVTSIYSALEIQLLYKAKENGTFSARWVSGFRFVKLYPEGGVFIKVTQQIPTTGPTTQNIFRNHYAYQSSVATPNGICLIELSGGIGTNYATGATANTLLVWITLGVLLETDYTDPTATYPASNLNTSISLYGLPSQQTFNPDDDVASFNTDETDGYLPSENNIYFYQKALAAKNGAANGAISYYFYLGSLLMFNNISSASVSATSTQPILIPYYCPYLTTTSTAASSVGLLPAFTAAFVQASSFANWGSGISRFVVNTSGTSVYPLLHVGTKLHTSKKVTAALGDGTAQYATLRFSSYNLETKSLSVWNGKLTVANSSIDCSGHVFLFSDDIIKGTTSPSIEGTSYNIGDFKTKMFYAYGKLFNHGILVALSGDNPTALAQTPGYPPTGTASLTLLPGFAFDYALKRSNATTMDNILDKVAYTCADYTNGSNTILSNYLNSYFVLDYPAYGSDTWTTAFGADITPNYSSDPTANVKVSVTLPVVPAKWAEIKFTLSQADNAVCGLANTSGLATPCDNTSSVITCLVRSEKGPYDMCCYGINLQTANTFSTLFLHYPKTSLVEPTNYYSTTILSYTGTSPSYPATGSLSVAGDLPAIVVSPNYTSHAINEGAISKMYFEIAIGRAVVRDMKLTVVSGEFSGFQISAMPPRCIPSFTAPGFTSTENVLFESCKVSLGTSADTIVVTTKKMIYKCNQTFLKSIYVHLWPIVVVPITVGAPKKYGGKAVHISSSNTAITADKVATDLSMTSVSPTVTSTNKSYGIQADLCNVSLVSHKFPGLVADYTFTLDLKTTSANLGTLGVNEVTIFFPYQYFGSIIPNIVCYQDETPLNCTWEDEGILNIVFNSNLTSGTQPTIVITGIPNPPTSETITFACSLNNFSDEKVRTNIISGTGKLLTPTFPETAATPGALRFYKVSAPITTSIPRDIVTHTFRIGFDTGLGFTTVATQLTGNPILIIDFPIDYKLWRYSQKPSITSFLEYNLADGATALTTTSVSVSSVTLKGNRVTIKLSSNALPTTLNTFKFWEVKIANIVLPMDAPTTGYTGPYSALLINGDAKSYYGTFTNMNTYSSDSIKDSTGYFQWYNGNKIAFDYTKWFISVTSTDYSENFLAIKPGRYFPANFLVKPNLSTKIAPSSTTMSISDSVFVTSETNYLVSTSYYQEVPFKIGCPCATKSGNYLVSVTSTDNSAFAATAPLVILVITPTQSTAGKISYTVPPQIPVASSCWIPIFLTEPNVEAIAIDFIKDDADDPTGVLSKITIPPKTVTPDKSSRTSPIFMTYSITASTTTSATIEQKFTLKTINSCWVWDSATTISITPTATIVQTPLISGTDYLKGFGFKYSTASDSANASMNKNAIKITFAPTVSPIYMYCALYCSAKTAPADADLMFTTYSDSVTKTSNAGYLLQYYFTYISPTSSSSSIDMIFNGLVRGQEYKLKCVLQTCTGDTTLRNSTSVTMENYLVINTTVPLTPVAPQSTSCAALNFNMEITSDVKTGLINYCQKTFSADGYFKNGCVICSDSSMSYVASGLSMPVNTTCTTTAAKTRLRLRFLETTTTTTTTTTTAANSTNTTVLPTITYTICAFQNPVCTSDPSLNSKSYSTLFSNVLGDMKTAALLNSKVGLSGLIINETNPYTAISDSAIEAAKLTFIYLSYVQTGDVKFTASYSAGVLKCYWQILVTPTTAPTAANIIGCTDTAWCGVSSVSITAVPIATDSTKYRAFAYSTSYDIYAVCKNDIPGGLVISGVNKVGTFTVPAQNNTNQTCPNNTGVWPNCTSSSFLSLSLIAILMILAFLF